MSAEWYVPEMVRLPYWSNAIGKYSKRLLDYLIHAWKLWSILPFFILFNVLICKILQRVNQRWGKWWQWVAARGRYILWNNRWCHLGWVRCGSSLSISGIGSSRSTFRVHYFSGGPFLGCCRCCWEWSRSISYQGYWLTAVLRTIGDAES